jgi:RNA polymerase sigma factor (TIGR02999 family)
MRGEDRAPEKSEVTALLRAWGAGEESALEKLTPLVYGELRALAHQYMMRERPDHTLQTTALVNEVYLRLVDMRGMNWRNRAHFFALSARLMRRILTDQARSRQRLRRGGAVEHVSLDEVALLSPEQGERMLALDEALNGLATLDPRKSQVVELRYFGGLSVTETAEVLKPASFLPL